MNQDVMDGIRRSTLVIVGLTLLDKVLALGKEVFFAYQFGVSRDLDVFNVAYAFPAALAMFLGQAVIAAAVPLYVNWREKGPSEQRSRLSSLSFATLIFFALLTLVCLVWSSPIMDVIGYGFPEGQKALGDMLERLLVWLILLDAGAAILAGVLQAKKSFGILYGAKLCINVSIIATLIFFGQYGVRALAYGFLAGMALRAVLMAVALWGPDFPYRPPRTVSLPALREFGQLIWPLVVGGLVSNCNVVVDQVMSTVLPAGSVSALRYAYRINDLPLQLFVVALADAVFPVVIEHAEARDEVGIRRIFWRGMLFISMISFSVTAMVVLFSKEIVSILLERGAFGPEAVQSTALTLMWYATGMIFSSYAVLNGMFFNAMRKNKPLMIVGVLTMVLNAFFNALFIKTIGGPESVAMSTTATMAVNTVIFLFVIQRMLGVFNDLPRLWPFVQVIGALLVAFFAAAAVKAAFSAFDLRLVWAFPLSTAVFAAIFIGSLLFSKAEEIQWCLGIFLPWRRHRA